MNIRHITYAQKHTHKNKRRVVIILHTHKDREIYNRRIAYIHRFTKIYKDLHTYKDIQRHTGSAY